jgi:hypothetical protein
VILLHHDLEGWALLRIVIDLVSSQVFHFPLAYDIPSELVEDDFAHLGGRQGRDALPGARQAI